MIDVLQERASGGTLEGATADEAIALRADLDALPIEEKGERPQPDATDQPAIESGLGRAVHEHGGGTHG